MMHINTFEKKVDEVMSSKGYGRTARKEKLGRAVLESSKVLNEWFNNYQKLEWITDKEEQLSGIDYKLTGQKGKTVNIDLKVGIGKEYSRIAVELSQGDADCDYWVRTFTNEKETDLLLFVNISMEEKKVYFVLVNYNFIVKELDKAEAILNNGAYKKTIFDTMYPNLSFNKTGRYFTISMDTCRQCRAMSVREASFDDLFLPATKDTSTKNIEKLLESL